MIAQSDLHRSGLSDGRFRSPLPADLTMLAPAISKLLDDASRAMERDEDVVRSCLARALALQRDNDTRDHQREVGQPEIRRTPAPARSGLAPWQIRQVTAYLDSHIDQAIRVADLAAISRLSVSYFSVAFRRSFGTTFRTFLARMRVERAQMLMVSTVQPLSQIALNCGFCDQAHLSRQFRRVVECTPQSWRREHARQPAN